MSQFLRPNNDQDRGGWTDKSGGTTNLYASMDESSPNDTTDYIKAVNVTSLSRFDLSSVTDPLVSTGHICRIRFYGTGAGTPEKLTVHVKQGAAFIKQYVWQNVQSDGVWTTLSYTLSAAEADLITDYGGLSVHFQPTGVGASDEMRVTWFELEVPDAGGGGAIPHNPLGYPIKGVLGGMF